MSISTVASTVCAHVQAARRLASTTPEVTPEVIAYAGALAEARVRDVAIGEVVLGDPLLRRAELELGERVRRNTQRWVGDMWPRIEAAAGDALAAEAVVGTHAATETDRVVAAYVLIAQEAVLDAGCSTASIAAVAAVVEAKWRWENGFHADTSPIGVYRTLLLGDPLIQVACDELGVSACASQAVWVGDAWPVIAARAEELLAMNTGLEMAS